MKTWQKAAIVIVVPTALMIGWAAWRRYKGLPVFGSAEIIPEAENNISTKPAANITIPPGSQQAQDVAALTVVTSGRTGAVKTA